MQCEGKKTKHENTNLVQETKSFKKKSGINFMQLSDFMLSCKSNGDGDNVTPKTV